MKTSASEPAYEAICGTPRRDSNPANCTTKVMTIGNTVATVMTIPESGTSVSAMTMSHTKLRACRIPSDRFSP